MHTDYLRRILERHLSKPTDLGRLNVWSGSVNKMIQLIPCNDWTQLLLNTHQILLAIDSSNRVAVSMVLLLASTVATCVRYTLVIHKIWSDSLFIIGSWGSTTRVYRVPCPQHCGAVRESNIPFIYFYVLVRNIDPIPLKGFYVINCAVWNPPLCGSRRISLVWQANSSNAEKESKYALRQKLSDTTCQRIAIQVET